MAYSDLKNTDDDARGFGHKLRDDFGWSDTDSHDYGNDSAEQDDFKLHSLGGHNNSYLDKHDFTYYSGHGSADNISFNNLNDAPHVIAQAFFLAGDQCLDNSHKQRVIGENESMFDDYIWGQGPVAIDPSDTSGYSRISNDVDVNNSPQADADGPYVGTAGQKTDLDGSG